MSDVVIEPAILAVTAGSLLGSNLKACCPNRRQQKQGKHDALN